MKIIEEYKGIPLVIPQEIGHGDNIYTLLTGKNGVGKSRLISELARDYTERHQVGRDEFLCHSYYKSVDEPKVIAVSTSPFDKFPLYRGRRDVYEISNYRYVGMRSISPMSRTSVMSLISSAMSGIFEQLTIGMRYERLARIFDVLGFAPEVQFIFNFNSLFYNNRSRHELNFDSNNEIHNILVDKGIPLELRIIESLEGLDYQSIREIADAISLLLSVRKSTTSSTSIEVDFSSLKKVYFNKEYVTDDYLLKSISMLLKNNIIRLMDVKLHKYNIGNMSLRRASSGEQCMLVMMLGIAGHISDNSIVLIDEPEISLHPKWQENFTSLLIEVFSNYRGCHFIIATHSPQIVSNLSNSSCFITSITKGEVYNARDFAFKSSDFQLAEIFDAPGTKNEYITRLAFSLLSKIKKQKFVSSSDEDRLEQLLKFIPELREDDSVLELILTIKEVFSFYASDK